MQFISAKFNGAKSMVKISFAFRPIRFSRYRKILIPVKFLCIILPAKKKKIIISSEIIFQNTKKKNLNFDFTTFKRIFPSKLLRIMFIRL